MAQCDLVTALKVPHPQALETRMGPCIRSGKFPSVTTYFPSTSEETPAVGRQILSCLFSDEVRCLRDKGWVGFQMGRFP